MRGSDLWWLLALALVAAAIGKVASALARTEDWQDRLKGMHAPLYARLCELSFWVLYHCRQALLRPAHRKAHLKRALLALTMLGAVGATPVALQILAGPDLGGHALATALGGLIWTPVGEAPRMAERVRQEVRHIELLPSLALILMVAILDVAVCCLAVAGVVKDQPASATLVGMALAASADIVSIAIGAAMAAFPHGLLPPRRSSTAPP